MSKDQLHSSDALLKILDSRGTEQGALDSTAVPKDVVIVLGPWVRHWRGNREMLSDFGDFKAIAAIPRGKPSGAWAACIGLMFNQGWREQASKAPIFVLAKINTIHNVFGHSRGARFSKTHGEVTLM